jgi:hypothetical protein
MWVVGIELSAGRRGWGGDAVGAGVGAGGGASDDPEHENATTTTIRSNGCFTFTQ